MDSAPFRTLACALVLSEDVEARVLCDLAREMPVWYRDTPVNRLAATACESARVLEPVRLVGHQRLADNPGILARLEVHAFGYFAVDTKRLLAGSTEPVFDTLVVEADAPLDDRDLALLRDCGFREFVAAGSRTTARRTGVIGTSQ